MRLNRLLLSTALALPSLSTDAFDLPGAVPRNYARGERVDLYVSSITPKSKGEGGKLACESTMSPQSLQDQYDYYDTKFHFCEPIEGVQQETQSSTSILFAGRTFTSPYEIKMLEDNSICKTLCIIRDVLSGNDAKFINDLVREDYALDWAIDGLPAAELKTDLRDSTLFYDKGFPLGSFDEPGGVTALNTHYEIVLNYHTPSPGIHHMISALVWPTSISESSDGCGNHHSSQMILREDTLNTVKYTYRVTWNESDIPWAARWDRYLYNPSPAMHRFNLVKSLVVTVVLCVMVFVVLSRSIPRDVSCYNAIEASKDPQEDRGWKVVHGDVFRTPDHVMILAIMVGNGAQLCAMVGTMLIFAFMGFRLPSDQGGLGSSMMICWSFSGGIGGYCSSRIYTSLRGRDHRTNALLVAVVGPVFVFVIACSFNIFVGSLGDLPFSMMQVIPILWLSPCLSAIGTFFGMRHGGSRHYAPVNQFPRPVPPVSKYLRPWPAAVIGGIFPFATAAIELPFLVSKLSTSQPWYGFLVLKAGAVALATMAMTALFTYFALCVEEYRWHWSAFLTGGGSAFWVLGYGLYYWVSFLSLDSYSSIVLYLGYLFVVGLLDFLITGTIGFLASYWVVSQLYSAIRLD